MTYDTQGGSAIASQEYGDMAALNLPEGDALPTKAGFVFSHWALTPTGTAIDHHIIWVEEDMTVYAVWKKAGNPVKVTIGDTKDVFTTNDDGHLSAPKFNGNSFIYLGCSYTQYDRDYSNAIEFSTEVFTKDTTVYLIYPTVWFHVEGRNAGGIANLHALYPVRKDTHRIGSIPDAPDNKEGYEFKGWSLTEGDTDESNKLDLSTYEFSTTSDTDIYPIWVSTRSAVTVTADGKTYTADDQGKITRPDDPASREGYWFKGWSRTENDTNPDNALNFGNEVFDSDTEIFPIWVKKVVVTADGKTYMVNEYGYITTPQNPAVKEGYDFAGWSLTEGDTNPDNKINFQYKVFTSDTEIYPIWVQQFTVTADGKTYKTNAEGKITTPLKPADKPDHIFAGWSRTENDTNIDNILDFGKEVFDTDTEIYPVWLTGVKVRVVDCLMKAKPWQMNCFHKADLYTVEERERTVETLSDGENKEYAAISFDGYKLLEDGWYWFVGGDDTVNWTDPNIKDNTKKTVVADYAGPAVVTLKFYYVDENMDYTIHDVFYTTDDEGKLIVQKDETRTGTYPFGSNLADNVEPLTDGAGNPPEGYYYFNKTDGTITDKPVLGYGDNFNYSNFPR